MKKSIFIIFGILALSSAFLLIANFSEGEVQTKTNNVSERIELPKPVRTGGMPLMDALNERKSSRKYSDKKLSMETISNLLWAADGINRESDGKRTAPTANDTRAMDVFVILQDGAYKYIPESHSLELIVNKDLREFAGVQDFVKVAPINLIYVEDYSKHKSDVNKEMYAGAHAGFISQNVYLFCAANNLNTVVRAYINKDEMKKQLQLSETQEVILAQTVGYSD